mmetsp:Transcript_17869/g.18634  ORF Transcript_17869/g.18634 Transcript_17869/m.18634 type:complete len:231 (-) Transcript_17869:146-838(-)
MNSPQKRTVTKNDHNELANHWSDVVRLGLNPIDSDNTYKHHVARLMNVYTNHKTTIDHDSPIPTGKKTTPLTQLYGVNGLISSKVKEETLKKREKEWQSRIVITENLDSNKRKEFLRTEANLRNSSESKSKKSSEPMETSKSQSTIPKLSQTSQSQSTQLNHRIDDSDMSENDLIANGLYYLDPEQMKVYNDFTSLLSSFDNFDMVRILEDALHDARKKTGLEDYGGTNV